MDIQFADGKKMTDEDILEAIQGEFRHCFTPDREELYDNWISAYGYYKGELPEPDAGLVSEAVSTDVSDTIEWVLPAILKPLVESPDVVRFDPVTPEDQEQADIESDYVHTHFMKRCEGFLTLYQHVKDALLLKVGVLATYWDEGVVTTTERYRNLTEFELAELTSPGDGSKVRILSVESHEEPIEDPLMDLPWSQDNGAAQPPPGEPGTPSSPAPQMQEAAPQPPLAQKLYDVSIRRYMPRGRAVVENVVPENFRVRMDHDSISLRDCRFASYTLTKSRSQLLAMGYDKKKVMALEAGDLRPPSSGTTDVVKEAREDVEREGLDAGSGENNTGDPSQDMITVSRVYIVLDVDGDGYEQKIMAVLGGDHGEEILDWFEVPECPFSASTPFIACHKFYGYSLYDKVKALADHKTKALRMLEDNMDLTNNPRKKAVIGQANLADLMLHQIGGIWRVKNPQAVEEIPTSNITQHGYGLLEYYDKMRAERTGIDPNAQSISKIMPEESMNSAVERVLTAKEELVGLLIRVFAETGVKDMFLKLRGVLMRNLNRDEIVRLRNKWFTINPGNWTERLDTTVVVGLGTGDRIRKTQGLMGVYSIQKELMSPEMGMLGHLVTPERIQHTIAELVRVQGLGDPDDFFIDPMLLMPGNPNARSVRGMEAMKAMQIAQQQAQQQQQMEQAKEQAAQQAQQQLLQLQAQIAQQQQETKRLEAQMKQETADKDRLAELYQFMREMRLEWAKLAQTGQAESVKAAAQVGTDLVKEGLKIDLESMKAEREEGAEE